MKMYQLKTLIFLLLLYSGPSRIYAQDKDYVLMLNSSIWRKLGLKASTAN